MKFFERISGRLRFMLQWKCKEPVVVFESDDWGLRRRPCADALAGLGSPADWAHEESETGEDLRALYETLAAETGPDGRPACFTANFIMANWDAAAIREAGFAAYKDKFLRAVFSPELAEKYREGIRGRVFYPQYHGRYNLRPEAWLRDLRTEGAARRFLEQDLGPAASFMKGRGWRYHSEYWDWSSGRVPDKAEIARFMEPAIEEFEALFGFRPLSTIPPHYIFTREAQKAWKKAGIRFVQGAGAHWVRKQDGSVKACRHFSGERSCEGLVFLSRNVKFDPRLGRPDYNWEQALRQIEACFRDRVPAVVDTHRINYTGSFRKEGLRQLTLLLKKMRTFSPYFLTTPELGGAVSQKGEFEDVFAKARRRLTPAAMPAIWRSSCPR